MKTVPNVPPMEDRAENLPCSDLKAHLLERQHNNYKPSVPVNVNIFLRTQYSAPDNNWINARKEHPLRQSDEDPD